MKTAGLVIALLGFFAGIASYNMDTSVSVGGGYIGSGEFSIRVPEGRVNNIGLMEDRRILISASGLAVIVGVILFGFGSIAQRPVNEVASPAQPVNEFATPEDTEANSSPSDSYQDPMEARREILRSTPLLNPDQLKQLVQACKEDPWLLSVESRANGNTLLHHAAIAGMEDEVRILLAAGADPKRGDCNLRSADQVATLEPIAQLIRRAIAQI